MFFAASLSSVLFGNRDSCLFLVCFIEVHPKKYECLQGFFGFYFHRFVKRREEEQSNLCCKIAGSKAYILSPTGFMWQMGINTERTCSLGTLQGSILKGSA